MKDCESWIMPEPVVQTKMVLENRKYCHHYPRYEKKIRKREVVPDLKQCKTPYTTSDHKLEACTQGKLLKLEEQFRAHHDLIAREKKIQHELCKELWTSGMRYSILTQGGACYKPYPEIVSRDAEHCALQAFKVKLRQIDESNCHLAKSLRNIEKSMDELEHLVSLLDMTVESPFVKGTWNQPSLAYLQEVVADMYQFYNQHLCKLNSWVRLLDPGDTLAIEDYQTLVGTSTIGEESFVHLTTKGCVCKRPNNPNCQFKYCPCSVKNNKQHEYYDETLKKHESRSPFE